MRVDDGGVSRRQFLRGGGGALLMAVGSSLIAPGAVSAALGAPAPTSLSRARKRTYASLIRAVGHSPSVRLDASAAADATGRFAQRYAGLAPELRRHVDAVLDAVEYSATPRFSALPAGAGYAHLRGAASVRSPTADPREQADIQLVAQALALAGMAIGPHDDRGHGVIAL